MVLIPVSGVHDATVRAVVYARSLRPVTAEAIYLATDPAEVPSVIAQWYERGLNVPLVLVEAPFRDMGAPLLDEIRNYTERGDTIVTVVLPELVPRHWWGNVLHNQTALFFKRLLLFEPDVVVTSVPFHLSSPETPSPTSDRGSGRDVGWVADGQDHHSFERPLDRRDQAIVGRPRCRQQAPRTHVVAEGARAASVLLRRPVVGGLRE